MDLGLGTGRLANSRILRGMAWIGGNFGGRDRWVWEFGNAIFGEWEIGDGVLALLLLVM